MASIDESIFPDGPPPPTAVGSAEQKESAAVVELLEGSGGSLTLTTADLHSTAELVADALSRMGIAKGCVVAMTMPNGAVFAPLFLGISRLAAIAFPLNPLYTADELKFFLRDSNASILILPPPPSSTSPPPPAQIAANECNVPIAFASLHLSDNTHPPSGPGAPATLLKLSLLNSTTSQQDLSTIRSPVVASDVCLMLYTSGTTGKPKAVPLSQANISSSLQNIIKSYQLSPNDATLLVMPLFHVHGLICGLLASLSAGCRVVIPKGGKFSASSFWGDVHHWNVTWVTAVPTIYQVLLQRARSNQDCPSSSSRLRFLRSCSSALPVPVQEELEAKFGVPVLQAYAMTEASHQMTTTTLQCRQPSRDSSGAAAQGGGAKGSVGTAVGSVRVKVLKVVQSTQHISADAPCRHLSQLVDLSPEEMANEGGEVCVMGPSVTAGYISCDEGNTEAFCIYYPTACADQDRLFRRICPGGCGGEVWFRTGDCGKLLALSAADRENSEGQLLITGRTKELINRGGEKISPLEIDEALLSHAAVSEVLTFGVSDEKYGEEVNAAVVLQEEYIMRHGLLPHASMPNAPGSEAGEGHAVDGLPESAKEELANTLENHLKLKIAGFKVPKKFYFVTALPKGPTGKVQRRLAASRFTSQAC